jgi:signal peptidase I
MTAEKYRLKLNPLLRFIRFYSVLVLATVFAVLLIRVFVFAAFTIPSNSMSPTILTGDKILINKLLFGGRIYNIFSTELNITRVKGIRGVNHNDILVFNFPYKNNWDKIEMDLNKHYVKRCIGLPGDTIEIREGFYKVSGSNKSLGILTSQQKLNQIPDKDLMQQEVIYNTFPFDTDHNWNIKNFGPLFIPKKGDSLPINTENFSLYKKLIEDETKGELSIKDNVVYLNSQKLDYYRFISNYYFLIGDNSLDSQDSRYWGLLPEYCIIGIVTRIWHSKDPFTNEYRNERILKKIR